MAQIYKQMHTPTYNKHVSSPSPPFDADQKTKTILWLNKKCLNGGTVTKKDIIECISNSHEQGAFNNIGQLASLLSWLPPQWSIVLLEWLETNNPDICEEAKTTPKFKNWVANYATWEVTSQSWETSQSLLATAQKIHDETPDAVGLASASDLAHYNAWAKNHHKPPIKDNLMDENSVAIDKYMAAMEAYSKPTNNAAEIIHIDDIGEYKQHQTLTIVVADENTCSYHRERMTRFVTSLNTHSTIKSDVMTLRKKGQLALGLSFADKAPTEVDYHHLRTCAEEAGWGQVIFLVPGADHG